LREAKDDSPRGAHSAHPPPPHPLSPLSLRTFTNNTSAAGYLWAVDPYGGGSDDFVTAMPYYLIGAAWDRGGR
jgi:hypothetical protein